MKWKQRKFFQVAVYEILNSIIYDSLIINANAHLFLREAKVKSYKLVKTSDNNTKLIRYFKSWADLQKALKFSINWDSFTLHWSYHTASCFYSNKMKSKSNFLSQFHVHNKILRDPTTEANTIPIVKGSFFLSNLTSNPKTKRWRLNQLLILLIPNLINRKKAKWKY
jgi:hypothetical protein